MCQAPVQLGTCMRQQTTNPYRYVYPTGGRTCLVGEGVILVGDQQDGGKKRQNSTSVSAFSAIIGVSLKCVL